MNSTTEKNIVVEEIRNDEERGMAYMTWEDVMRYEHEAGVEEGEQKNNNINAAKNILAERLRKIA